MNEVDNKNFQEQMAKRIAQVRAEELIPEEKKTSPNSENPYTFVTDGASSANSTEIMSGEQFQNELKQHIRDNHFKKPKGNIDAGQFKKNIPSRPYPYSELAQKRLYAMFFGIFMHPFTPKKWSKISTAFAVGLMVGIVLSVIPGLQPIGIGVIGLTVSLMVTASLSLKIFNAVYAMFGIKNPTQYREQSVIQKRAMLLTCGVLIASCFVGAFALFNIGLPLAIGIGLPAVAIGAFKVIGAILSQAIHSIVYPLTPNLLNIGVLTTGVAAISIFIYSRMFRRNENTVENKNESTYPLNSRQDQQALPSKKNLDIKLSSKESNETIPSDEKTIPPIKFSLPHSQLSPREKIAARLQILREKRNNPPTT